MPSTPTDDAFARLVRQLLMADAARVEAARAAQAETAQRGETIPLGEAMVRLGVITPAQREAVEQKLQAQQRGGIQQLLHYKLLKKIGEGGMGTVYLAEDTQLGRKVALKVLPKAFAGNENFMARFHREADALGRLNHANIVRAFSVAEDQGWHFFVMEYCEGETLDKRLQRDGFLPHAEAAAIVRQVAEGLQYAHELGFIHRDIKPGNIILVGALAKILDMGLSKNLENDLSLTQSGAMVGTPYYMSPEQARGDKAVDGRSDIYSLGATFYHLVTGVTPFRGNSVVELVTQHVSSVVEDPRSIRKTIPPGVTRVLRRMLEKRVEDRYPDCREVVADLDRMARGEEPKAVRREEAGRIVSAAASPASETGRPGAALPASVSRPEARADRPRPEPRLPAAPATKRKGAVVAVVAAIAVAAVAFAVARSGRGRDPSKPKPPVPAGPVHVPAPDPVADLETEARGALDALLTRDDRGSLTAEALRRGLEAIVRSYPDTKAARIAQERIDVIVAASLPPARDPVPKPPAPPVDPPAPPVVPPVPVAPPPDATGGVDDPARWARAKSLLAEIDPAKHAVAGRWEIRNGELWSDKTADARIEIPVRPPAEYDYRIRFVRRDGNGDVLQILAAGGRQFAWQMAGSNNTVFGFATVRGQRVASNPTTIRRSSCFETGRMYTSTVQVRKDGVSAWLDGQPLCRWATDYADMDLYAYWKLRDASALGLATCGSAYAIRSVELLDAQKRP
jgi:hypothetical protein